ncbi:hypothetical protein BDN72DRAFT_962946 [Pluteus cervinus]|uniref:Uncharacterized protein n=1 Tax=Pluteus cervinus TaxID=181527 RepID=A0ACD3AGT9_9AGAR|nr:hypothetical protein BDN72DRAFT_962946 [Pluteus cervinus]
MQPEIAENQRHHRFFLKEEFITLKVDEVYFNLPTFILMKHSRKLEKLITDRTETDPECFAALVQGVSAVDLERFLAVLFPTEYGQYEATSFDEWASILKVAHNWEFESIVKLALEKIEPVSSPVDKLILGRTYNIPGWATEARVLLCRREEPITQEEGCRMGTEEVVNISQARHHIRSSEIRPGVQDSTIHSILSREQDEDPKENVVVEIALPPDTSQGVLSDSAAILGESPVESKPAVHRDPRLSRAIELRTQLEALKYRLVLVKESEDVETQIDDLEDEYLELYKAKRATVVLRTGMALITPMTYA